MHNVAFLNEGVIMSIFTSLIEARVPADNHLRKLNALIRWTPIQDILIKHLGRGPFPVAGVKPYDLLSMFKAILLQSWHSLSDPELEDALRLRFDFMLFTGFEVEDNIPDETTLCRFRNQLVEKKIDTLLFTEINYQLEQKGLKVKAAHGAVIDASVIESAARPHVQAEVVFEDRSEPLSFTVQKTQESCDPDAKWLKKGRRCYFGYKLFVSTDVQEGYIEHLSVTSANRNEAAYFGELIRDMEVSKGRRIYADKGYASEANRELIKQKGLRDGIMEKGVRGKALRAMQRIKNKLISKKRYIVEQTFGTLKRRFKFTRARYMTIAKVTAEALRKAMCQNLLKALRKVQMIPKMEIKQVR